MSMICRHMIPTLILVTVLIEMVDVYLPGCHLASICLKRLQETFKKQCTVSLN